MIYIITIVLVSVIIGFIIALWPSSNDDIPIHHSKDEYDYYKKKKEYENRIYEENIQQESSKPNQASIDSNQYELLTYQQLSKYKFIMGDDLSANYLAEHIIDSDKIFRIKKETLKQWEKDRLKLEQKDNDLILTAANNNKGIQLEKEGLIDKAIQIYKTNLEIGYPALHSYERLIVIYHRQKKFKEEAIVLQKAIICFSSDARYINHIKKWENRLKKLTNKIQ